MLIEELRERGIDLERGERWGREVLNSGYLVLNEKFFRSSVVEESALLV